MFRKRMDGPVVYLANMFDSRPARWLGSSPTKSQKRKQLHQKTTQSKYFSSSSVFLSPIPFSFLELSFFFPETRFGSASWSSALHLVQCRFHHPALRRKGDVRSGLVLRAQQGHPLLRSDRADAEQHGVSQTVWVRSLQRSVTVHTDCLKLF